MSTAPLVVLIVLCCLVLACAVVLALIFRRQAQIWLPSYIAGTSERRRRWAARRDITHVIFAFVDHFEPVVKPGQDPAQKSGALADWLRRYPALAAQHRDSDGRPPRHSWTFPLETYDPSIIEQLLSMCRSGLGEIEVHLHHDGDTAESFRARMEQGLERFAAHGVGVVDGIEGHRFAFVHGDWALDNSHPEGRYCGVNNELAILRELGCFADVTLPSAPGPTQTRKINSIYYATDDPARPKSHDTGIDVEVGRPPSGDLMIIQGPLLFDWRSRKLGVVPRIDNGAITGTYPGRPERVDAWVRLAIGVVGRPDWVFVKVHCHGANVGDREAVLGEEADTMFRHLETRYGSGAWRLHYVTVREMFNIIKAAEAGKTGNPNGFRDYAIPAYSCLRTA